MKFNVVNSSVSTTDFKLLFTPSERVQLRALINTDAVIADMFALLDDIRTLSVNLDMPQIGSMLDYLIVKEILTEQRKDQILNAEIPSAGDSAIPVPDEVITE